MRNDWFPRGIANYLSQAEIKDFRLKNIPIERDYAFISSKHAEQKKLERLEREEEEREKAEEKALEDRMDAITRGQSAEAGRVTVSNLILSSMI